MFTYQHELKHTCEIYLRTSNLPLWHWQRFTCM